jgi:hypothetical protein
MTEHEDDIVERVTERFERRLAEECGQLRVEMATSHGALRAEMAQGFGTLRAEMIERNAELLKWALIFAVTQTGVLVSVFAALFGLFR